MTFASVAGSAEATFRQWIKIILGQVFYSTMESSGTSVSLHGDTV